MAWLVYWLGGCGAAPTDPPRGPAAADGPECTTFWLDVDGDGYPGTPYETCGERPPGAAEGSSDCDDEAPEVHPTAWDAPLDGIDADCNGADEDGSCRGTSALPGPLVVEADGAAAGFCARYNQIAGDLRIGGTVTELSDLSCLCAVDGDVVIEGTTALADLAGLANLATIGGTLRIEANEALVDASVLASVWLDEDLEVVGNPVLAVGPALDRLGGDYTIVDVPALLGPPDPGGSVPGSFRLERTGITSLRNVAYQLFDIGGDVVIAENPDLESIDDPFPDLQTVGGQVVVEQNDALHTVVLSPFIAFDDVAVRDLPVLETLDLEIDWAWGNLTIERNPLLETVPLYWLRTVAGDLRIADNPSLVWLGDPQGLGFDVGGSFEMVRNSVEDRVGPFPTTGLVGRLSAVGGDFEIIDDWMFQWSTPPSELAAIGGDLRIQDSDGRLDHLGFDALVSVGGSIELIEAGPDTIEAPLLTDLGGGIRVEDSPTIRSFRAPALPAVSGDLVFRSNPNLATLDLGALETVAGTVEVDGSPALDDLGLGALRTASAVAVEGLTLLPTLGLPGLESTTFGLVVERCDRLASLSGLDRLEDVGGQLWIAENVSLSTLDGAPLLRHAGSIVVRYNPALLDVSGLHGLEAVDGDLDVSENAALGDAAAQALADAIDTVGGTVTIGGNGP